MSLGSTGKVKNCNSGEAKAAKKKVKYEKAEINEQLRKERWQEELKAQAAKELREKDRNRQVQMQQPRTMTQ